MARSSPHKPRRTFTLQDRHARLETVTRSEFTYMPMIEGLAVNGLTALASAAGGRLLPRALLLYRMGRAIRSEKKQDLNASLLDALQRAFGNQGQLVPATNDALLDITHSGLLEHIVAIACSDIQPDYIRQLIIYIHQSRGATNSEESETFANKLIAALREVGKDALSEALGPESLNQRKRIQSERDDNARAAEAAVANIVAKLKDRDGRWIKTPELSPEAIRVALTVHMDPINEYCATVERGLNQVDVHGASGERISRSLDDVFVEVPVSYIARNKNFNRYRELRGDLPRAAVGSSWRDVFERVGHTVLLGDPGGGKSTLSKKLCLEAGRAFQAGEGYLPIFVQLRTYISYAVADERLTLSRHVNHLIQGIAPNPEDEEHLKSVLLYHLRVGRAFIVFDGLDEVLTAPNRRRVVDDITTFAKAFPLCKILVTSRYVGYETQPLPEFSHLGVEPLTDDCIDQIFLNITVKALGKTEDEAKAALPSFKVDCRNKASDFAQSPLILTLIIIIYGKKSEIPDNRASLYASCAELLFEVWDSYRAINPYLPERYRLFDLLMHIAAELSEKEEYGGRITKDDLERVARNFFREDYIDNREGRSAEAAVRLVEHLTGRSWILHEIGENLFEFTHRTFLEYFYAKHLEAKFEITEKLVASCLPHVSNGRRTLSTHLALQIRCKDKRTASSKVAVSLSLALKQGSPSEELVDFCVDTLEYLLPEASSLESFIGVLSPVVFKSENPFLSVKLLDTNSPLRSQILGRIEPELLRIRTVKEISRLSFGLHSLAMVDEAVTEPDLGRSIVFKLMTKIFAKQRVSPFLTNIAFRLDTEVDYAAAAEFGLRFWFNSSSSEYWISYLSDDCKWMLEASLLALSGEDMQSDKYFLLGRAVYRKGIEQAGSYSLTESLYRRDAALTNDFATWRPDPSAWGDKTELVEQAAFCMVLFLEICANGLPPDALSRWTAIHTRLTGRLTDLGSAQSEWHQKWLTGENGLIRGNVWPAFERASSFQGNGASSAQWDCS